MLCEELLIELVLEQTVILLIVHLLNDASPLPVFNEAFPGEHIVHHRYQCVLRLLRVLLTEQCSKKSYNSLLNSLLDESELFIALTSEYLAEKSDVMILLLVGLDPSYDGSCPLNDQIL